MAGMKDRPGETVAADHNCSGKAFSTNSCACDQRSTRRQKKRRWHHAASTKPVSITRFRLEPDNPPSRSAGRSCGCGANWHWSMVQSSALVLKPPPVKFAQDSTDNSLASATSKTSRKAENARSAISSRFRYQVGQPIPWCQFGHDSSDGAAQPSAMYSWCPWSVEFRITLDLLVPSLMLGTD